MVLRNGEKLANTKQSSSRSSAMIRCASGKCDPAEFDYMTCTLGVTGLYTGAYAVNLHNGNVYSGGELSIQNLRDLYKIKHTPILQRRASAKASVGCMLYSIQNIQTGVQRGLAVDMAMEGASLSASGGAFLQFGIDKSLVDPADLFEKDKNGKIKLSDKQKDAPVAIGVGVGLGGGADAGFGIMNKIGNVKDIL